MRILATLDEPTAGDAFVDGFSVVDDPDRVRRRLGFMPDYFGTYQNVNVREYLDFFARAYGLVGRERLTAIGEVMEFTLLDTLAEKPINGLSKGMKQRLCLGRTMIHNPSVLVLDEPAAGLDPRARIELREMISQLAAAGKAILISSHILTELAEICDRVGIIEQGRLLAVGSVAEISAARASAEHGARARARRRRAAARTGWPRATTFPSCGWTASWPCSAMPGDREAEAALLRAMVEAAFRSSSLARSTRAWKTCSCTSRRAACNEQRSDNDRTRRRRSRIRRTARLVQQASSGPMRPPAPLPCGNRSSGFWCARATGSIRSW